MFGIEWPNWDLSMYFDKTTVLGQVIELLIYTAIAAIITTIVLALYNRFVKKALKKKNNIQIRFTQNIIRTLIILAAIIWVLVSSTATTDIGKVLFQGTAIIGAVVGLAAQPVIGDLFSELDNGIRGVVIDITIRHVVIRTIDTVDVIVPNSKINASLLTNMSPNTKTRSAHLRFNVAYGTDVKKAMDTIRRVVEECEYTIPAWKGKEEYGPVYFISYADSSLVLATTIYYRPSNATEIILSDINCRVNEAFAKEGIEIPFNYVNVVMKENG